ncbi:hypothetical protein Poly41_71500 [Novipirellula artificiosorum]|uniref:Uncharacterized protein n=1 Tax=Novipirellula artificiosorum TaxID=2528016 RepID=A0A5C6CAV0_9BACT|nr:hypothetical protein Poly41_71500 [Novipirellula artificiosorum]
MSPVPSITGRSIEQSLDPLQREPTRCNLNRQIFHSNKKSGSIAMPMNTRRLFARVKIRRSNHFFCANRNYASIYLASREQ